MFKILNKNIIIQWFLLFMGLVSVGYQIFNASVPINPSGFPVLFNGFYQIFISSILTYRIGVCLVLLFTLLLIQFYFFSNKFSQKQTIIPSIIYIAVLLLTGALKQVTPILFTNFFIILILAITDFYFKSNSKSNIFYSGIIIGIAVLFDPSALFLLIYLIISMIINTVINPKDLYIALMGLITVVIFTFAFYFFFDHLDLLYENFKQIGFFSILKSPIKFHIIQWGIIPIEIILFVYILFKVNIFYESKVIALRKKIITFSTLVFTIIITLFLSHCDLHNFVAYYFIPISILISIFTQLKSKYFINELIVLLFFVGLCL
jgi:hypothetical protein